MGRVTSNMSSSPETSSAALDDQRGDAHRFAWVALTVAGVLLALFYMQQFSGLIGPVFFALNLVVTAYPVQTWLIRKGTPGWLATIVMGMTMMVLLLVVIAAVSWAVGAMGREIPNYSTQFYDWLQAITDFLARFGFDSAMMVEQVRKIDPNSVANLVSSVVSGASGLVGIVVVIVTCLIFMVMDASSFSRRIKLAEALQPRTVDGLLKFSAGVRRYWLVTTVFGLIVALLDGVVLLVLDVPLLMVWILISFVTNYVPNIGFIIGLVPAALMALFANGWQSAVALIVAYSVLNFVVQSIIQPRFTGESVGVTPTISFLSLLLWGTVLGGLGTLLALPMTMLVKTLLIDMDPKSRWVNTFLASDPKEALSDDHM